MQDVIYVLRIKGILMLYMYLVVKILCYLRFLVIASIVPKWSIAPRLPKVEGVEGRLRQWLDTSVASG
ncbi:MAG: hypothetical protein ACK5LC_17810 [Coprobacillaceae bacterium]